MQRSEHVFCVVSRHSLMSGEEERGGGKGRRKGEEERGGRKRRLKELQNISEPHIPGNRRGPDVL